MIGIPPTHAKRFMIEVFSKLLGPRRIIVGLLCGLNNQLSAVTCKGDFPFPFQAFDHLFESEVRYQYARD